MKRKHVMTALMCAICLSAATVAPATVLAEETELETEVAVEEAAEESTEAETETEFVEMERPEYEASGYVTLGEYKGLTVEKSEIEVTDEEIDAEIQTAIEAADALETVTEGEVQVGDIANIDYEGKLDGEAFDGGTAEGYDLEIGSGTFIDGFEDGLVGVAIGDTVDLPLTFPENYGSDTLAGQDVIFTVTVNEVKRTPELSDELVSTVTDGAYTDVDSYRESIRESLEADKETTQENQMKYNLFTQVANNSEILDYPQEMLDYGVNNMESYYRQYAEMYSMEFADFLSAMLGMTEEEFQTEALEVVKENLQQEMYLQAIAEAENMEISDEEYAQKCEEYAAQYGYETAEELVEAYGETIVRVSIMQDKVLDFLLDNAVITEAQTESAETELETEA